MSVRWDEMKRSMERSFKANWKLFKQSKLGIVGLGIILFFLILAIFAPIIPYTYSTGYLAPAGDLFEIDNYTKTIPTQGDWHSPVSIKLPISHGRPPIAGIWIYSSSGKGYLYPRNTSVQLLLRLKDPVEKKIPVGMKNMVYLEENTKVLGFTNNSLYLYSMVYKYGEYLDTQNSFKNPITVKYNYPIEYYSNIWDENTTSHHGTIAVAVASNRNVSLFIWSYYKESIGGLASVHVHHFAYNFTVNSTIVANPKIRMHVAWGTGSDEETWIIIPTKDYVYRYNITLIKDNNEGVIAGVSSLHLAWENPIIQVHPPLGKNADALMYSSSKVYSQINGSLDMYGVLCDNNYAFGLYVKNGKVAFNKTVSFNSGDTRIRTVNLMHIQTTGQPYFIIYGTANGGGIVGKIAPALGDTSALSNYIVLRGSIQYVSEYAQQTSTYYVSTKEGAIYQINDSFYTKFDNNTGALNVYGLYKSFMVSQGIATPMVYLGNILGSANNGGYIGAVTKGNTLYFQADSGHRIPTIVIPPFGHGRYSGNFYLFGTDYEGHDVWTWLVYGSRTSLIVGLTAAFISVLAGTFIGIISGFYGGWIDIIIMRTVDIILTLPGLVIMLLLAAILGPSIWNIVLIISVLGWAGIARVIRAVTLSLKGRPFMDAARVAGASNARMITVHIFPNVLPLTFLYMTFGVASAILSEAALAFLGLGDPNSVSWGMMLQFLRMYGQVTNPNAWGWLLMPGIFIALLSLAFYLVGRAFDEIVNPRLRKR